MSIYGHLRHTNVPSPYLIRADWSPHPAPTERVELLLFKQHHHHLLLHWLTDFKFSHKQPVSFHSDQINNNNSLRAHEGEITGSARPPRDTWIAAARGSIRALLSWATPVLCPAFWRNYSDTCALCFINDGLNITAMTGKLADKIPLTMSSLINTIPDSLYPEEDIPTSMNIFTSTESINHYSQMNTGKKFVSLFSLLFSRVRACVEVGSVY